MAENGPPVVSTKGVSQLRCAACGEEKKLAAFQLFEGHRALGVCNACVAAERVAQKRRQLEQREAEKERRRLEAETAQREAKAEMARQAEEHWRAAEQARAEAPPREPRALGNVLVVVGLALVGVGVVGGAVATLAALNMEGFFRDDNAIGETANLLREIRTLFPVAAVFMAATLSGVLLVGFGVVASAVGRK